MGLDRKIKSTMKAKNILKPSGVFASGLSRDCIDFQLMGVLVCDMCSMSMHAEYSDVNQLWWLADFQDWRELISILCIRQVRIIEYKWSYYASFVDKLLFAGVLTLSSKTLNKVQGFWSGVFSYEDLPSMITLFISRWLGRLSIFSTASKKNGVDIKRSTKSYAAASE